MRPKVTFGIVNCNRLHYLKSCFESLVKSTDDYDNREFIVVDNASLEVGTQEYLEQLANRGVKVFRASEREPHNEFARGINQICREAEGDYVCPLQGDMQFIVQGGWLERYVDFFEKNKEEVGSIMFDAQRAVTNNGQAKFLSQPRGNFKFPFLMNTYRSPIAGAADVMYSREILEMIGPWSEDNQAHEGGLDSETEMLDRVRNILSEKQLRLMCAMPIHPVSIAIYTDARGTNARVRGTRRYGDYWPAKQDDLYYEMISWEDASQSTIGRNTPLSIEEVAHPIGWDAPIDAMGSWKKNPIRPETAASSDYVELEPTVPVEDEAYLSDWLDNE